MTDDTRLLVGGLRLVQWQPAPRIDPTLDERLDIWGRDHHALVRREGDHINYLAGGRMVRLPRIERKRP